MRKSKSNSNSHDHGEMDAGLTTVASNTSVTAPNRSINSIIPSDANQQITSVISPPLDPAPANTSEIEDVDSDVDAPKMTNKLRRLMDMAIVTDLVAGTPIEIIAKNLKLDVRYISRVRGEWLKACKLQESIDYRHELKSLSLDAIREGLQKGDVHKRMNGGIRVMSGIGEFQPEIMNINVLQRLENIPPELRSRFVTSDENDEVIETEVVSE